jgi:hypothetical protein
MCLCTEIFRANIVPSEGRGHKFESCRARHDFNDLSESCESAQKPDSPQTHQRNGRIGVRSAVLQSSVSVAGRTTFGCDGEVRHGARIPIRVNWRATNHRRLFVTGVASTLAMAAGTAITVRQSLPSPSRQITRGSSPGAKKRGGNVCYPGGRGHCSPRGARFRHNAADGLPRNRDTPAAIAASSTADHESRRCSSKAGSLRPLGPTALMSTMTRSPWRMIFSVAQRR